MDIAVETKALRRVYRTRAQEVVALDGVDHQAHLAVVDQDAVTDRGVLGQRLVGGRDSVVAAFAIVDGDPHRFAVGPVRRPRRETPEPDLRALQVGEHTDRAAGGVGGGPHAVVGGLVIGVVAVTEVHSGDVHSGLHQRQNHLVRVGCRAKGADDLPASTHGAPA